MNSKSWRTLTPRSKSLTVPGSRCAGTDEYKWQEIDQCYLPEACSRRNDKTSSQQRYLRIPRRQDRSIAGFPGSALTSDIQDWFGGRLCTIHLEKEDLEFRITRRDQLSTVAYHSGRHRDGCIGSWVFEGSCLCRRMSINGSLNRPWCGMR